MLFECGKNQPEKEIIIPNFWWVENPFSSYQDKITLELNSISCAWTKSFPPYWLKKSGMKLTRKGDRIFKQ
jgi:hypothetical protein